MSHTSASAEVVTAEHTKMILKAYPRGEDFATEYKRRARQETPTDTAQLKAAWQWIHRRIQKDKYKFKETEVLAYHHLRMFHVFGQTRRVKSQSKRQRQTTPSQRNTRARPSDEDDGVAVDEDGNEAGDVDENEVDADADNDNLEVDGDVAMTPEDEADTGGATTGDNVESDSGLSLWQRDMTAKVQQLTITVEGYGAKIAFLTEQVRQLTQTRGDQYAAGGENEQHALEQLCAVSEFAEDNDVNLADGAEVSDAIDVPAVPVVPSVSTVPIVLSVPEVSLEDLEDGDDRPATASTVKKVLSKAIADPGKLYVPHPDLRLYLGKRVKRLGVLADGRCSLCAVCVALGLISIDDLLAVKAEIGTVNGAKTREVRLIIDEYRRTLLGFLDKMSDSDWITRIPWDLRVSWIPENVSGKKITSHTTKNAVRAALSKSTSFLDESVFYLAAAVSEINIISVIYANLHGNITRRWIVDPNGSNRFLIIHNLFSNNHYELLVRQNAKDKIDLTFGPDDSIVTKLRNAMNYATLNNDHERNRINM